MSDRLLERTPATDYVTALGVALWTTLQDHIEEFGLKKLDYTGGTMSGNVVFADTQTFMASAVMSEEPTYTKTASGSGGLLDVQSHMLDSSIHANISTCTVTITAGASSTTYSASGIDTDSIALLSQTTCSNSPTAPEYWSSCSSGQLVVYSSDPVVSDVVFKVVLLRSG